MSKFYLNFLNNITYLFVPSSVELKEVSHSIKNGWIARLHIIVVYRIVLRQKKDPGKVVRCKSKFVILIELF